MKPLLLALSQEEIERTDQGGQQDYRAALAKEARQAIAEIVRLLLDAIATIEAEDDPDNDAWLDQAKSAILKITA